MADIKYSQLGAAVSIADSDILPMVNMSANPIETNKTTAAKVKEYVIGNTDISGIGNGTPTGAISSLKSGKTEGTAVSKYVETIGSTALGDYAVGKTFLATNGKYYKATATITGGTTTLTENTNCEETTVSEELASLNSALTNVDDTIGKNGAKNLLSCTGTSQVENGVRFTVNSDDTVTVTRESASNDNAWFYYHLNYPVKKESYHLSGCPSGNDGYINCYCPTSSQSFNETSSGVDITLPADETIHFYIVVRSDQSPNGAVFKPMLTLKSQPYSDYAHFEPHAKTNRQLTEETDGLYRFTSLSDLLATSIPDNVNASTGVFNKSLPKGVYLVSANIRVDSWYYGTGILTINLTSENSTALPHSTIAPCNGYLSVTAICYVNGNSRPLLVQVYNSDTGINFNITDVDIVAKKIANY